MFDAVVVGGGAAGMMAAITAAERGKQDEKQSKAAEDSILLDNSELDFDGTVNRLLEIVEERTGVKHG